LACGKGAAGKRLPGEAASLSTAKAEALLCGFLSADGHYVKTLDRWMVTSVSKALLLGMAMVVQRARGVYATVLRGREPRKMMIENRPIFAKQEWNLAFPNNDRFQHGWVGEDGAWRRVRKVEPIGDAEVWDLQVEGDESFTAEGCIVHNCPLQLGLIERCVRMWSNRGETVFSPFAGIGSEGVESLRWGRKFYGVELKDSYFTTARRFLADAEAAGEEPTLFDAPLIEELA
jgi:hypothetical protein